MTPLLQLRHVSKNFGGLAAVRELDLEVSEGEALALIGPNGAGKTTLVNLIAGVFPPSTGQICFQAQDITSEPAHNRCRLGIVKTFQLTRPFAHLSVRENAAIGAFLRHHDPRMARRKADFWLAWVGLEKQSDRPSGSLSTADRKRLEVARALAAEPKLLLLDEVFAGLNAKETEEAFEWANKIHSLDITLVLIEHVLEPVTVLARRVVVLDQGKKICDDTVERALRDPRVAAVYLGTEDDASA